MDLEAIINRRPELVLVDELAHTNIEGATHPKRWQDVCELLDAGIDVYTSVNVQHIESCKDTVESFTQVSIHETVPDSILDRAYQIRLIDISPEDLLKRLGAGQVYLGEKAQWAQDHFFKLDRLTALREIALRMTAEKVDQDLQTLSDMQGKTTAWKISGRLLVAVSHSPFSKPLIRSARRMAKGLEVPWVAVHVDVGQMLCTEDRDRLSQNLAFARSLGAEVIVTSDPDMVSAIRRIVVQKNVSHIVLGRPHPSLGSFFKKTLPEQLIRQAPELGIYVLPLEKLLGASKKKPWVWGLGTGPLRHYAQVVFCIAVAAFLSTLLVPLFGYRVVGYLFLMVVMGIGLVAPLGPILLSATLSALIWDFFFIPPFGTLTIQRPEDFVIIIFYFFSAMITGLLTYRIRTREKLLRTQESRTAILFDIVKDIATSLTREACMSQVGGRLGSQLKGHCQFYFLNREDKLSYSHTLEANEEAVLHWVWHHKKMAGWSTDTLAGADALYIPLICHEKLVGVLAYTPTLKSNLLQGEESLLHSVSQQMAVYFEKELLREEAFHNRQLEESEKLYQVLLDCVSHEIKTPLNSIMGLTSALEAQGPSEIVDELNRSASRLTLVVDNLLDMSRLNSGLFALKKEWQDPEDIVRVCLDKNRHFFSTHQIDFQESADTLPLIRVDFMLFEHVLSNVIRNAVIYSPTETAIEIRISIKLGALVFSVADHGPRIPQDSLDKVFQKFYRIPGSSPGGTGLGLALAKSIMEAHGGQIWVENGADHGAIFSMSLPLESQPDMPNEKEGDPL